MIRFLTISFVLSYQLLINNSIFSQTDSINSPITNQLNPRLDVLIDRYNKTHKIHGYRIQIISSSKKDMAKKIKSKFASRYNSIQAHQVYQQPFFIIKVGNFLTKIEAEKFHREILIDFPGSFVIPDVIDPYEQYTQGSLN